MSKRSYNPSRQKRRNASSIRRREINNRGWRSLSRILRRAEPICQLCGKDITARWAGQVDHLVPRSQGGSVRDQNNMAVLCVECHGVKTLVVEQRTGLPFDITTNDANEKIPADYDQAILSLRVALKSAYDGPVRFSEGEVPGFGAGTNTDLPPHPK